MIKSEKIGAEPQYLKNLAVRLGAVRLSSTFPLRVVQATPIAPRCLV